MGYRSTFVTSHCNIEWPQWFRDKYQRAVYIPEKGGVIASVTEGKFYSPGVGLYGELVEDIAKVEGVRGNSLFWLVVMHEDGLVDRYEFPEEGEPVLTNLYAHERAVLASP